MLTIVILFQAHSDDDDGPDDVAVNVDNRELFMDDFFAEVCLRSICILWMKHYNKAYIGVTYVIV